MKENAMNEKVDMLAKIYEIRQCDFEELSSMEREEIKEKISHITIEEIQEIIEKNIAEQSIIEDLSEKLDKLIEDYEIKMAFYMEKRYKQGFQDAIRLIHQCESYL